VEIFVSVRCMEHFRSTCYIDELLDFIIYWSYFKACLLQLKSNKVNLNILQYILQRQVGLIVKFIMMNLIK